jgi:basic membrane protein A and related proteins
MKLAVALMLLAFSAAAAHAQPRKAPPRAEPPATKVAVLFGSDRAANDDTIAALDLLKKTHRIALALRIASKPEGYASLIDQLAAGAPALIIGAGGLDAQAFRSASAQHPTRHFLLIDAAVPDVAHLKSVTFRTDEASFLAGVVAAVESKRGRVGFVGAVETEETKAHACAFETGVRWATKERFLTVRGRHAYIGATPETIVTPDDGESLSQTMIQMGADVLYAAAGASGGAGVIAAARHARVKAINLDADSRQLRAETVITSVRKRIDRVVETALSEIRRQSFSGGSTVMNLANGGVDLVAPGRLAPTTLKLVEKARATVVSGDAPTCVKDEDRVPAWNFPPRPQTP